MTWPCPSHLQDSSSRRARWRRRASRRRRAAATTCATRTGGRWTAGASARVVDWLLVAPLAGVTIWLWGWHLGTFAVYQCLLLILHHVFEVTTGATPGKRLFGLRVARLDDGGLPRPRQAAIRGVVGIFEFGLIAPIVIVCNKGRRRVGDFLAGTAVVDARKHPVAPRPLFRGALVYPAVWAVPALVACVLGARGELPGTYRQQADNLCAARQLIGSALAPDGKALPVTESAAIELEQTSLGHIEALGAPRAWRARHDDLVHRLRARLDRHVAAQRDLRADTR
ncbi:MAG TPA: RDD family protein, partial [Baekduia sp.]|nr:RDD family protein [Baekduia sp.]